MALIGCYPLSERSVLSEVVCLCRNLHRPHARTLSRTKNVRVSDGDRRRNQPHPNEDDKPPGRRFLRSSSHLAILPPNILRHHGRYIRSSSLGPSFCPYSPECVE